MAKGNYVPPVKVPGTTVSLLTNTSKMPCVSWSLPAGESCPWALYGEGAICDGCYAQQGMYVWKAVTNAQHVRFDWVRDCLKTDAGTDQFVRVMASAITQTRNNIFRVHDSGDLFSSDYIDAWTRLVPLCPGIQFWFPTRSSRPMRMSKLTPEQRMRWEISLLALAAEPNVTVRPSALFVNAPAPVIPGLAAGSGASDSEWNCPASTQNNECGSCRMCWFAPETPITYHLHGTAKAARNSRAR